MTVPPTDATASPSLPLFDPEPVDQLRSLLGDEMVGELFDEFLRSGVETLGEFDAALAAADLQTARRHVHGLKSAAASLGLTRLSQHCLDFEMACRDEQRDILPGLRTELQSLYDASCAALSTSRPTPIG